MNVIDLIANSPSFSHSHLHYTTPADSSRRNPSVRSCLVSVFHSVQLTQSTTPPSPFSSTVPTLIIQQSCPGPLFLHKVRATYPPCERSLNSGTRV